MSTKKILLGLVAAASALSLASAASAAGSVVATSPVTMTISTAINLTRTTSMAFGTIIKPSIAASNTVVLAPTGTLTISGAGDGSILTSTPHSQAIFSLVAPAGTTYASTTSLSITPALSNVSATTTPTTTTGTYGTVPTGGIQDLNVGGQFDISDTTVAQAYTGTLSLTVNYN